MDNRLQHKQAEQLTGDTRLEKRRETRSFEEAEHVIRADREQTPVPPGLGDRLADTLGSEPAPVAKPWWKRLLG